MQYLEIIISSGVFGYLIKNFLGATADMSRAILSLRYFAQYMLEVQKSSQSDQRVLAAWKKLHKNGGVNASAMKVLSSPYLIPSALFVQHELSGLEKEKEIGSEQIRTFAKYVVRAGRLHVNGYRDPSVKHVLKRCRDISFYEHDVSSPLAHDLGPKQMKSAA